MNIGRTLVLAMGVCMLMHTDVLTAGSARQGRLLPPVNDNFADRVALSGTSGLVSGNNAESTLEPGEPVHSTDNPVSNSVWYSWTAPADGVYAFDFTLSPTPLNVAVYTGTQLDALTLVMRRSGTYPMYVSLATVVGATYHFALAAKPGVADGSVTFTYYPDVVSDWLVRSAETNSQVIALPARDGSMCFAKGDQIRGMNARTNQNGLTTAYAVSLRMEIGEVGIVNRENQVIYSAPTLPGGGAGRCPVDYNGKAVLALDFDVNQVVLYSLRNGTLEQTATQPFPASIVEVHFDGSLIMMYWTPGELTAMQMGCCAYDKTLTRQQWVMPLGPGGFESANAKKGYVYHTVDTPYAREYQFLVKGAWSHTRSITLPYTGSLQYHCDPAGGLLLWMSYPGGDNANPSYYDRKGRQIAFNQPLSAGARWSFDDCSGKMLFVTVAGMPSCTVYGYSIGTTFTETAQRVMPNHDYMLFDGSKVLEQQYDSSNSGGLLKWDKKLQRSTTIAGLAEGEITMCGPGLYLREMLDTSSGTSNMVYTIYGKNGEIATHSISL